MLLLPICLNHSKKNACVNKDEFFNGIITKDEFNITEMSFFQTRSSSVVFFFFLSCSISKRICRHEPYTSMNQKCPLKYYNTCNGQYLTCTQYVWPIGTLAQNMTIDRMEMFSNTTNLTLCDHYHWIYVLLLLFYDLPFLPGNYVARTTNPVYEFRSNDVPTGKCTRKRILQRKPYENKIAEYYCWLH